MMTTMMRHTSAAWILSFVIALAGTITSTRAQDASPWNSELHAAARLIAGAPIEIAGVKLDRAGIEVRLDTGWKTYWRYPGVSGVPPTFDFAGSENVKSVTPLWPAPERFADGAGGFSIGYRGDVILPLHVVLEDASKPSSLHLRLGYAICGKLCVPAQADLTLPLSNKAGAEEPALAAAEARIPRPVSLGTTTGLGVASVHREVDGGHERVIVDVTGTRGAPVDVFVEGPSPDWALPVPEAEKPVAGAPPERRQFAFAIDGLPQGVHAQGAMLTLTIVTPDDAVEVKARLD
jgi:DsbC/DsbD-like thiol-disulfide interchange protein